MKRVLLIVGLFLVPTIANAGLIENENGWFLVKDFILPSGLIYQALEMIQPKEPDEIKENIIYWAEKGGINPNLMVNLANCESRLNPYAKGDWRSETKEYKAYGLFQWWASSWKKYNNFFGENYDRYSWKDQVKLTALVLKKGDWKNWYNCLKFASL